MMGYMFGPQMMGWGWGLMSLLGWVWILVWTVNSVLLGVLLWVLIQKNLGKK